MSIRVTRYFYTQQGTPDNLAFWFDYRIDPAPLPAGAVQVAIAHDQTLEVDYPNVPWMGATTGRKAVGYWCGGANQIEVGETLMSLTGLFWSVIKDPWEPRLG